MEFKDNVIYVTPDGIAVNPQTLIDMKDRVIKLWEDISKACTELFVDIVRRAVNAIHRTFEQLIMYGNDAIERIKQTVEVRQTWYVPRDTRRYSQFTYNKPRMNRVRNAL